MLHKIQKKQWIIGGDHCRQQGAECRKLPANEYTAHAEGQAERQGDKVYQKKTEQVVCPLCFRHHVLASSTSFAASTVNDCIIYGNVKTQGR
jgi:hypothetical protein